MGLMAARMAGRMQTRQTYRTVSRMQRRRTWAEQRMGMRQDFQPAEPGSEESPPSSAEADYTVELERLASLRDSGVITNEDFEAKKRQVLGL